jgi:hypothetical protein
MYKVCVSTMVQSTGTYTKSTSSLSFELVQAGRFDNIPPLTCRVEMWQYW